MISAAYSNNKAAYFKTLWFVSYILQYITLLKYLIQQIWLNFTRQFSQTNVTDISRERL